MIALGQAFFKCSFHLLQKAGDIVLAAGWPGEGVGVGCDMGRHQLGCLVTFGPAGVPDPIVVHTETVRQAADHELWWITSITSPTLHTSKQARAALKAQERMTSPSAVKRGSLWLGNSCEKGTDGSKARGCLELWRNVKVVITTLIQACQSIITRLSRPQSGSHLLMNLACLSPFLQAAFICSRAIGVQDCWSIQPHSLPATPQIHLLSRANFAPLHICLNIVWNKSDHLKARPRSFHCRPGSIQKQKSASNAYNIPPTTSHNSSVFF